MELTGDLWKDHLAHTLSGYEEKLLRLVSQKLSRPRNQWPPEELVERNLVALENPAVIDRRIKEMPPGGRQILALVGHSKQPCWPVGALLPLAHVLGSVDGLEDLRELFVAGFAYPLLFAPGVAGKVRFKDFDAWLATTPAAQVFFYPPVTQRALTEPLTPPEGAWYVENAGTGFESDGLEWLLRLTAMWQRIAPAPLRRTQQRDFFKRDLDRLREDSLLAAQPSDGLGQIPDPGLWAVALGLAAGLLREIEGEIQAEPLASEWSQDLESVLTKFWSSLLGVQSWNAKVGWDVTLENAQPHFPCYILALTLLGLLPENAWAQPEALESSLVRKHPYWQGQTPAQPLALEAFFLGVAYPLKLVQAIKLAGGGFGVRLSPMGQRILGYRDAPVPAPQFPQTILVQPNLEILAYRQGLTPELVVKLTRLATWKGLGGACTLQLEPSSVYRALEMGESFSSIVQTLDRYGMKPTPAPVLDALKTWSNKRERITVYPSAALLEFPGPAELSDALARGLPAIKLTDRLAVVANESQIDYRHFRMTGTRDYVLPPEKCVSVEPDGVTLSVDLSRSDLLLDTELSRFAEPLGGSSIPGRRQFRITPASMAQARLKGMPLATLEQWFHNRTGMPLAPAARLFLVGAEAPPMQVRRQIVLHIPSEALAEGLWQWPETRALLHARLGPVALAVLETQIEPLTRRLAELGITLHFEES